MKCYIAIARCQNNPNGNYDYKYDFVLITCMFLKIGTTTKITTIFLGIVIRLNVVCPR